MECAVLTSQHVSVQQDLVHGGICTRTYTGSAVPFILLHLNVPSTKFGKAVTALVHWGEALLTQQCSDVHCSANILLKDTLIKRSIKNNLPAEEYWLCKYDIGELGESKYGNKQTLLCQEGANPQSHRNKQNCLLFAKHEVEVFSQALSQWDLGWPLPSPSCWTRAPALQGLCFLLLSPKWQQHLQLMALHKADTKCFQIWSNAFK